MVRPPRYAQWIERVTAVFAFPATTRLRPSTERRELYVALPSLYLGDWPQIRESRGRAVGSAPTRAVDGGAIRTATVPERVGRLAERHPRFHYAALAGLSGPH